MEAAYSLRDKAFIENLGTIILYAVVVSMVEGAQKYIFVSFREQC